MKGGLNFGLAMVLLRVVRDRGTFFGRKIYKRMVITSSKNVEMNVLYWVGHGCGLSTKKYMCKCSLQKLS